MANEKIYELCEKVDKVLRDDGIGFFEVYPSHTADNLVNVEIYHGDWKHEHLRADWLISEKLGGTRVNEWEIGESDSDCYSACHQYEF